MQQGSYHTYIRKEGQTFLAEFPHINGTYAALAEEERLKLISILRTWAEEHQINPQQYQFKVKFGEEFVPVTLH